MLALGSFAPFVELEAGGSWFIEPVRFHYAYFATPLFQNGSPIAFAFRGGKIARPFHII